MDNMFPFHGDCIDVMKTLPDKCADAVFADLPYGTTDCHWDSPVDLDAFWEQCNRLVKTDRSPVIMFSANPFTIELNASNKKNWRNEWLWLKNVAHAVNTPYSPMRITETVSVFTRKNTAYHPPLEKKAEPTHEHRPVYNKSEMLSGDSLVTREANRIRAYHTPFNIKYFPVVPYREQLVKTEKPIEWLIFLTECYTEPGPIILDPTMGSGTSGVAARNMGRQFIGIEKDPRHFEIAYNRIHGLPIL